LVANFYGRSRKKLDLATLLKICPQCLGDLVFRSDFGGEYYRCLQCNLQTEPMNRIGRLPELPLDIEPVAAVADSFAGGDAASPQLLMG
jgi:hypothetical protein